MTGDRLQPVNAQPFELEDEFYSRLPREAVRAAAKHLLNVAQESGGKVVWGGQGLSIQADVPKAIWGLPVTVAWFFPEPGRVYWAGLRDFSFGAAYPDYHNERLNDIMRRWAAYFSFGEGIAFDGENGGGGRSLITRSWSIRTPSPAAWRPSLPGCGDCGSEKAASPLKQRSPCERRGFFT